MGLSGRGRGRPADLVAVAGAVVGAAAAAQVIAPQAGSPVLLTDDLSRRIVRRAHYDALKTTLQELDGWIRSAKENIESGATPNLTPLDDPEVFYASDFRRMVNDAARDLGTDVPWQEG